MKKTSDHARTSKATRAKAIRKIDGAADGDATSLANGASLQDDPKTGSVGQPTGGLSDGLNSTIASSQPASQPAGEPVSKSVSKPGERADGSSVDAIAAEENFAQGAQMITLDGDGDGSRLSSNPISRPIIASPTSSRRHTPNRAPNFQQSYQPVSHSSDRIAIFIDGSNLFYAASHLNIEVDYRRLLSTLVRDRRLLRAYFYTGVDPQNEKQRGFLLWLNRHGHRVVSKELVQLPDGSRKANMHVEMAVDMMRISEYCSTLTLLGGDGNLAYALQVLSQRGTAIEVVSLQSMTSDSLIDLADSYTDLADLRDEIKR